MKGPGNRYDSSNPAATFPNSTITKAPPSTGRVIRARKDLDRDASVSHLMTAGAMSKATPRQVIVGLRGTSRTQIVSGLSAGQQLQVTVTLPALGSTSSSSSAAGSGTLGGTGKERGDRHPKVRDGVLLCAGAKVLGNVEIGRDAKVGAGSVVLHDVPPRATVAGVPARIVGWSSGSVPALEMDQSLPDYEI